MRKRRCEMVCAGFVVKLDNGRFSVDSMCDVLELEKETVKEFWHHFKGNAWSGESIESGAPICLARCFLFLITKHIFGWNQYVAIV